MTVLRPQRFQPAPIGSLLKREPTADLRPAKAERKGGDVAFLAAVRMLPCLYCGMEPSEAAHVRFASAAHGKASGLGKKPEDRWALPLCAEDHRMAKTAQHNRNEQEFWASLGINPLLACEALYAQRGDLVAMQSVIHVTIANRSKQP